MDYLPMVYRFNPLTFKPRNGYGVIYSYNVLNKIYIGQTKNSMRARHRAHIYQDSKNCVVDEYLSSNVYILKIITLAPEDDLNNLEMYFIEQYNTIWPYGWNFTSGGRNYKREETSRLINSYKHTGSKNQFYGKKHSQDEINRMKQSYFETIKNKKRADWQKEERCKKVYMYDMDMNFIKEYQSVREQQDENNTYPSSIRRACNGIYKHTANHKWSFQKI